jgi:hypothetical protein
MPMRTKTLSIQDFLLFYILGDTDDGVRGTHLRSDVHRHRLRTSTVQLRGGRSAVVTRCTACPIDDSWPCVALRELAAPYARHPAYQPEWHVDLPEVGTIPQPRSSV